MMADGGRTVEWSGIDLSVVIVNYKTRQLLDDCLASVFRSDLSSGTAEATGAPPHPQASRDFRFEVIVVDNCSGDGSIEMVHSRYPQVRLLEMGQNVGFARACNEGIKVSSGRYIMLLNSDTVVHPYALRSLIMFLDVHHEWAAVGPLLRNRDGTVQASCFAFPSVRDVVFESLWLMQLFPHSAFFNHLGLGGFDHTTTREVDWVSGACLTVRRSVIERVGLLDEEYFMYGEELDWCYRMKHNGLRIVFFPGAEVIHYGRSSSSSMRSRTGRVAMTGRLRYFRKYHGVAAVTAVRFMTIIGMTVRLLAAPIWYALRPESACASLRWYWGMFIAALTAPVSAS